MATFVQFFLGFSTTVETLTFFCFLFMTMILVLPFCTVLILWLSTLCLCLPTVSLDCPFDIKASAASVWFRLPPLQLSVL